MQSLYTRLREIEDNLSTLSIDDVKGRLLESDLTSVRKCPIFDPGMYLYRGRVLTGDFRKNSPMSPGDLSYPPAEYAKLGRANRHGAPVFYASTGKESVFYEIPNLKIGDELILGIWQTDAKMLLNNLGYTKFSLETLGSLRSLPYWATFLSDDHAGELIEHFDERDSPTQIYEVFSQYFTKRQDGAQPLYKLSAAIAELQLGEISGSQHQFAGIIYPAVALNGDGDNVAIQPWYVDQHLQLKKAKHVRVTDREGTKIKVEYVDEAYQLDPDGHLCWLGRRASWQVLPQQSVECRVVEGVDSHGDYQTTADGVRCHWELRDVATGTFIPAV
jgi:hypothetical protein